MQKCGNCGHENRAGVVFCENCGASLIGKQPLSTKSLDTSSGNQTGTASTQSPLSAIVQEMAIFKPGDSLKLTVEGATKAIELQPKGEVILGRRDPATGATPDVDLTPYAGYRMGVSRRHAAIRQGEDNVLNVWDLGSSNGTFLNGQRLNAHRPYPLHDGDELRLGQMVIRVHFKPASLAVEAAPVLPSTKPLQPPPAAGQTIAPAQPAAEAAPMAATPSGQVAPAEKPAPASAEPAVHVQPAAPVEAPTSAQPEAAAPASSPAKEVLQAAEPPVSASTAAPEVVQQVTDLPAPPAAPAPEAAAPVTGEPTAPLAETKPPEGAVSSVSPQEEQEKAPPPPAEKRDEPKTGENNTAQP